MAQLAVEVGADPVGEAGVGEHADRGEQHAHGEREPEGEPQPNGNPHRYTPVRR